MSESTHSATYQVLYHRLTNGVPYTTTTALARITALANALTITQDEAETLTALATQYGTTAALTVEERLALLEAESAEHDAALIELAALLPGGESDG